MASTRYPQYALALFGLIGFCIILTSPKSLAKEDDVARKSDIASVREWFLDSKHSVEDWDFATKLGAAELLYFCVDHPSDDFEPQRKRIENILSSLLSEKNMMVGQKKPPVNKENTIRALMLRTLITPCGSSKYNIYATSLYELDQQNGVVCMLRADYDFSVGNFWECIKWCYKSFQCSAFSFRDNRAKKNMLKALDKAGLTNKDILIKIICDTNWDMNSNVIIRHVSLLSFLHRMETFFSVKEKPSTLIFPERQYLSYLENEQSIQFSYKTYAYQLNSIHQNALYQFNKKVKDIVEYSPLIQKERSLLALKRTYLLASDKTLAMFLDKATVKELRQFILAPEEWWSSNKPQIDTEQWWLPDSPRIDPNQPPPDYHTWRNFWAEFQAEIEKFNMPPKQPDELQPGNLQPGMLPGMRPKTQSKNKD